MREIAYKDFQYSIINGQGTIRGTTCAIAETNSVFFILSIDGASSSNLATVKNVATTTITVRNSEHFGYPLRMDGGFSVTAGSVVTVKYSKVSLGS